MPRRELELSEDHDDVLDPEDAVKAAPKSAPQPDPASSAVPSEDLEPLDRTTTTYKKWYAFVLMWLRNFDQDGEQPDRGEETRSLGLQRDCGAIVTMIRGIGKRAGEKRNEGLTHAVYEVIESAFSVQESARLDGLSADDRKKLARQVAENITQVSSLFFYDLSDLLEYHNPLEEEED